MGGSRARFFEDDEINFVFLIALGGAYDRVADVGACLAIADQITDGDAASAYDAFTAAGARLAAIAETAAAAGRRISACEAYLQAANYTFAATYFADRMGAPERLAPTWRRHQALWNAGAALLDPPMEQVRIRYENTTLPGYVFKADDSGRRRPLLILNNGSDGLDARRRRGARAGLPRADLLRPRPGPRPARAAPPLPPRLGEGDRPGGRARAEPRRRRS